VCGYGCEEAGVRMWVLVGSDRVWMEMFLMRVYDAYVSLRETDWDVFVPKSAHYSVL